MADQDPFAGFKAVQKEAWSLFTPMEVFTTPSAAKLVSFAGVATGQMLLDVGCGTGVAAITAARRGAKVRGLDLSPVLLERAREHAQLANLDVDFAEGDAESLPYGDNEFDVVLSQFGHMFAPRPKVAIGEMLRVLKPGGTIAFSTWPPHLYVGRMFALIGRHLPRGRGLTGVVGRSEDRRRTSRRESEGYHLRDGHHDAVRTQPAAFPPHHGNDDRAFDQARRPVQGRAGQAAEFSQRVRGADLRILRRKQQRDAPAIFDVEGEEGVKPRHGAFLLPLRSHSFRSFTRLTQMRTSVSTSGSAALTSATVMPALMRGS